MKKFFEMFIPKSKKYEVVFSNTKFSKIRSVIRTCNTYETLITVSEWIENLKIPESMHETTLGLLHNQREKVAAAFKVLTVN